MIKDITIPSSGKTNQWSKSMYDHTYACNPYSGVG